MDNRKPYGKSPAELKTPMEHLNADVVLDVQHAYTNDSTQELFKQFQSKFKGKISHYHLSGYKTTHDPLHITKQKEMVSVLDSSLPIIIETVFSSKEDIKAQISKEHSYILDHLSA